jgi:hypothetical protein
VTWAVGPGYYISRPWRLGIERSLRRLIRFINLAEALVLRGIMRAIRHIASEQLVGPESRCIGVSTTCYPVATAPGTDLLIAAPHELFQLVNQQHAMDKGNLAVIACAGKTEQG